MYPQKGIMPALMALLFAILVLFTQEATADFSIAYCSSQNTGSSNGAQFWTWQSNGWCHDQCVSKYAFAVVQDTNCWCADYIPSNQQDTSSCNADCPGFPDEKCGNKDKGLFGYIALNNKPSGTQGASRPSSTVSAAPSPQTSAGTSTPKPQGPSTSVPPPSSSAIPSSTPPSTTMKTTTPSSAAPTSTFVPTPITSVQTLTVSGVVVTQTVTSMSTPPPSLSNTERKGNNAGVIAGAVIGTIVGVALIAGLVMLLLWRRRKHNVEEGESTESNIHRNTSTMSKAGLLPNRPTVPQIVTSNKRGSQHMDSDSTTPVSMSDRRNSRPMFFDQRLNPSAIMDMDNMSRSSLITMEDNRDYTRTLNIRNPDLDSHSQK